MYSRLDYNPLAFDMVSAEVEAISAALTLATNAGGRLAMELSGRTVNNLLGTIGACEAVAGVWSLLGSMTMADDATTKVFGTNSTRATCASANSSEQLVNPIARFDLTKYYLYTMWVKNNNLGGGLRLYFQTNGTGKVLVVSSFSTSTSWTRIGIVVQPSNYGTGSTEVELGLNTTGATAGQYGNIDGIMVNEITSTEYALGTTALMALYPYHDGVKSTGKQTIVSTDGTLSTTATSPVELKSVGTVSDTYNINTGLYTQNTEKDIDVSATQYDSQDKATYTNVDVIKTTAFSLGKAGTTGIDGFVRVFNADSSERSEVTAANIDLVASVGKFYYHTDKTVWFIVAADTYEDIAAARTGLGTSRIDYQLATPVTTQYNPQILSAYPSGTVTLTPETAGSSTIPTVAYSYDTNLSARVTSLEEEILTAERIKSFTYSTSVAVGSITGSSVGNVTFTIPNASVGDFIMVSTTYDVTKTLITGFVKATNTVLLNIYNRTGSSVDYGTMAFNIRIVKL